MSWNLLLVLVVTSAIITPIIILLIPRARRSTLFDTLLWVATLVVAILGGWYAFGMADAGEPLGGLAIAEIPIVPVAIGALVGAMAVNLPLWLLDRFEHPAEADTGWEWEEEDEMSENAAGHEPEALDEPSSESTPPPEHSHKPD